VHFPQLNIGHTPSALGRTVQFAEADPSERDSEVAGMRASAAASAGRTSIE
jgi:hypothetical protein